MSSAEQKNSSSDTLNDSGEGVLRIAKEVFEIEAKAISNLCRQLTEDFYFATEAMLATQGKVILSGMGKSGLIAKKIAATLASTGTPSFFIHPAEAYHGDLGMIEPEDIVLLISYSGETDEVLRLMPFLRKQGNIIVAMSAKENATLVKNSHYFLSIAVEKEACPLHLAPTSSTTATLVMGDALAIALMKLRGFQDEHFARFHPGGTLGKRLLTTAKDVMRADALPVCEYSADVKTIVSRISLGKLGLVVVLKEKKILGVITDGDIRRAMDTHEETFFKLRAEDLYTADPKCVSPDSKLTEISTMMTSNKIHSLLVVNEDATLLGVVQMYDLGI